MCSLVSHLVSWSDYLVCIADLRKLGGRTPFSGFWCCCCCLVLVVDFFLAAGEGFTQVTWCISSDLVLFLCFYNTQSPSPFLPVPQFPFLVCLPPFFSPVLTRVSFSDFLLIHHFSQLLFLNHFRSRASWKFPGLPWYSSGLKGPTTCHGNRRLPRVEKGKLDFIF